MLPDWSTPALSVDALLLPRKTQPAKVRAALNALTQSRTASREPKLPETA